MCPLRGGVHCVCGALKQIPEFLECLECLECLEQITVFLEHTTVFLDLVTVFLDLAFLGCGCFFYQFHRFSELRRQNAHL